MDIFDRLVIAVVIGLLIVAVILAALVAVLVFTPQVARAQSFNLQCQSCTEQPILTPSPTATSTATLTPTPTMSVTVTLTPTFTTSPTPAPTNTASPVCASIPPLAQLQDSAGNIYTLDSRGNILVNGSSDAGGSSVNLVV